MLMCDVEITKTIRLSEKDISDIISACFCGGCNYWARINNTTSEWKKAKEELKGKDPTFEDIILWILDIGYSIEIEDVEDEYEAFH